MGTCSSRDDHIENLPTTSSLGIGGSILAKNLIKSLRYNDSDFILFAFNGEILTIQ